MIILGIDPGYSRLGYAIFEKNSDSEKLIECGCVETSAKKDFQAKMLEIGNAVDNIIKKTKPETLSIEKVFFTKNQKTALKIAEIRGAIVYIALKNKLKIAEYTPLEVKSAVCGYGKAPKEQVAKMVKLILGLKNQIKQDDAADAVALCITHAGRKNYPV